MILFMKKLSWQRFTFVQGNYAKSDAVKIYEEERENLSKMQKTINFN
jgi:hypothetical protein